MAGPRRPPVELVEWLDAQHPSGEWTALDDHRGPLPVILSAGFVVHEDKNKLVIASAWDGRLESGGVTIPKAMVRKRRVMR